MLHGNLSCESEHNVIHAPPQLVGTSVRSMHASFPPRQRGDPTRPSKRPLIVIRSSGSNQRVRCQLQMEPGNSYTFPPFNYVMTFGQNYMFRAPPHAHVQVALHAQLLAGRTAAHLASPTNIHHITSSSRALSEPRFHLLWNAPSWPPSNKLRNTQDCWNPQQKVNFLPGSEIPVCLTDR